MKRGELGIICSPFFILAMRTFFNGSYFFFDPFLSGACVKAEAATDFTLAGVFLLDNSLPAFDATLLDVFSFLDMTNPFCCE